MPMEKNGNPIEKYECKGEIIEEYMNDDGVKNQITMSIWVLGGQKVFYTLHHLFLTEYAVYSVVFNIKDLINKDGEKVKESLNYIRHWLQSIFIHARGAPIFLIGTFKDEIKEEKQHRDNNKKLLDLMRIDMEKMGNIPNVVNKEKRLEFWPIDNSLGPEGEGIKKLRKAIVDEVENMCGIQENSQENNNDNEDIIKQIIKNKIPLQWTATYDMMREKNNHITLEYFHQIAQKNELSEGDDRVMMLRAFHQLGMLLYFDKEGDGLKDVIVLNPQWLVDAITKIIREFDLHEYDGEIWNKLRSEQYYKDFKRMKEESIAGVNLRNLLWRDEDNKSDTDFTIRKYLLSLMEKMTLAAPWSFKKSNELYDDSSNSDSGDGNTATHYLIPSNLRLFGEMQTKKKLEEIEKLIPFSNLDSLLQSGQFGCLVVDFLQSFLPIGFFDKLLCLLVGYSSSNQENSSNSCK